MGHVRALVGLKLLVLNPLDATLQEVKEGTNASEEPLGLVILQI